MGADKKNLRYFDVVMLSYYERSIFDVLLNGVDIGAAGPPPHKGSGGVIVGVPVTLGSQLVTWRLDGPEGTPRNGETVTAKNQPVLEDVDPDLRYLGVHIYPDDTVEIIPEMYWPSNSPKGEVFLREWEAKHGRQ